MSVHFLQDFLSKIENDNVISWSVRYRPCNHRFFWFTFRMYVAVQEFKHCSDGTSKLWLGCNRFIAVIISLKRLDSVKRRPLYTYLATWPEASVYTLFASMHTRGQHVLSATLLEILTITVRTK